MEFIFFVCLIVLVVFLFRNSTKTPHRQTDSRYTYARKSGIMTASEKDFFHRLTAIVAEKYYVFPQVHLSALAINKTYGKYHKLGFQRINRRSIDYVLADKGTLQPVYAIELDDTTHDTEKGRANDTIKNDILTQIGLPLVRFRDPGKLSDTDIAKQLYAARGTNTQ